ncbi:MAG: hypothetical protein N2045_13895 [Fimbriimonadales bacterium]|nr:hypothetical protein [Fimbriimonadales bacterium]
MAEALETVFVNIEARLSKLESQLNESVSTSRRKGQEAGQGYTEGFQRGTKGVEEALLRLSQIAIGGAIVQQFRALAAEASQSRIAVDLFARQLERTGQSAQAGLAALDQVASRLGTLPSSLADNATQLLRQGLSFQEVITVFERAAASGLAAGKSTQQAIDAVTQAIVNQQSIYLNYAGISQNLDVAYKEFARSLNKTTDELTQQERAQAAVALIVKATKEEYEDLDRMLGGLGGTPAQLNKAQAQLRQELGTAVQQCCPRAIED